MISDTANRNRDGDRSWDSDAFCMDLLIENRDPIDISK